MTTRTRNQTVVRQILLSRRTQYSPSCMRTNLTLLRPRSSATRESFSSGVAARGPRASDSRRVDHGVWEIPAFLASKKDALFWIVPSQRQLGIGLGCVSTVLKQQKLLWHDPNGMDGYRLGPPGHDLQIFLGGGDENCRVWVHIGHQLRLGHILPRNVPPARLRRSPSGNGMGYVLPANS